MSLRSILSTERLLSPRNYVDMAVQTFWRLTTRELPPVSRHIGVEPGVLAGLAIDWPAVYQWPTAASWGWHLMTGFGSYVTVAVCDLPQRFEGIILARLRRGAEAFDVAIDYADRPDRIHPECLDRCLLYFKMQYLKEGYSSDKIVPGRYVPSSGAIYRYLPHLRQIRQRRLKNPRFAVYGRYSLKRAGEIRRKAVETLNRQTAFHYQGGGRLVPLSRSLREAASSALCLDLPGIGPFCHRLIDYMAVGACIVAFPHRAVLDPPLQDRTHLVYCREDFSDLLDLCSYYLSHEEERIRLGDAARQYFDEYLHKDRLAAYYLTRIARRLGLPVT